MKPKSPPKPGRYPMSPRAAARMADIARRVRDFNAGILKELGAVTTADLVPLGFQKPIVAAHDMATLEWVVAAGG